ncbi:hypothetical protein ACH5RR_005530 [Cinchona calisaya]|uniref:RING-type E3 ubiquitin transferase n=1 Tax=Cinchona calisaya TaxID=153742 RepID=A0ABD3ALP7_9GENT
MDNLNIPEKSFYIPLLISLAGVLSTCIALVVYRFIIVKYCMSGTSIDATAAQSAPILSMGVDEKLLKTIPIIAYSTESDSNLFCVDQAECVVCLGELEHGEMVRLLPNCNHAFHVQCIDEWFLAHTSCPICRSPILSDAEAPPVLDNPFPSPPQNDYDEPRRDNQNDDGCSSSGVKGQSLALIRHCGSLVWPTERPPSSTTRVITGLKRSLSLDQSSVIIDIQREDSSSSSSKDDIVVASSTSGGAKSKYANKKSRFEIIYYIQRPFHR